jgi:hypothetical protein
MEQTAGPPGKAGTTTRPRFDYTFAPADAEHINELKTRIDRGVVAVEQFFERPFREPVSVTVCPDREAFTRALPAEWGLGETQCWMVASGVADRLIILSPRVWRTDACEHDPADEQHVQGIVTHELVHVFHGQYNPTRDFTGAEEVGWFAEGLAVYVSGQLEQGHLAAPREAIELGLAPKKLEDAWSGKYRYGVCGSIVAYIDHTYGREILRYLLVTTTQEEFLFLLGLTEQELLDRWRASVLADDR